jgi:hypothetical protein
MVTHNRPGPFRQMLSALEGQTRKLDYLVVVDNGQGDEARRALQQTSAARAGVTRYVPTGANLGPAGGFPVGFAHLPMELDGDDWVLLLDDDDPPAWPTTLEKMCLFAEAACERDPRTGVVGIVGARIDRRKGVLTRVPDDRLQGPVPVDYIGANQMLMVRGAAFRDVGTYDTRLFFGFEELEFCLRVKSRGWSVLADGDAWLERRREMGRIGVETRPRRLVGEATWRLYYNQRNLIHILRRNSGRQGALRLSARGLLKPLASLPLRPGQSLKWLWLQGWGTFDGWTGRLGRPLEPGSDGLASLLDRRVPAADAGTRFVGP